MSTETKPGHIFAPPPTEQPVTGGQATVVTAQGAYLQGVRQSNGTVYVPATKETYSDKR